MAVRLLIFVLIASTLPGTKSAAQKGSIQIQLGPDEIGENQSWPITITATNEPLRSYDNFPDISGFRKRGTSNQSQTNIVNGQVSFSQSVTMTYTPTQQGVFQVATFKIKVNDQVFTVTGKKVKVGPPVQQRTTDPLRSFFYSDPGDPFNRPEPEFIDIKEDALLALTTSKDEVFVGEGFTTTLSFLVAENNRAPMQFYELGKQLGDILKKLRPGNCWEENFNIETIEGESIEINGKGYTQYKIYQAVYYPLNAEPVTFPGVGLKMIKFKVAKNPSFFGQNRQEDFKIFLSKPKTVRVKELPPHPLRESVAVGNYRLQERIIDDALATGQSTGYDFSVYGEGNISSVEKPAVQTDGTFDFYEPNVKQNIRRENGRVTGTKTFSYYLIPKEPGVFAISDYFQWIFFNPNTRTYDTLRPQITLRVEGESQKNQSIESSDLGTFYDRIETTDNTLRAVDSPPLFRWLGLVVVILSLAASLYLMLKK